MAVITTGNAEDIVSAVIGHLVEDGVEVHLIDHGSSDRTSDEASPWLGRGLLGMENYPIAPGDGIGNVDPEALRSRSQEIWDAARADWCMHRSADEISYGPWPGLSLLEAIEYVDGLGFTAIQTQLLTFRPVDDSFRKGLDPSTHFLFWEERQTDTLCFKPGLAPAEHVVFPIQFITCRYPIRNPRQAPGRRAWDPSELHRFSLEEIRLDNALSDQSLEQYSDLGRFLGDLRQSMDAESDVVTRALELVSRRRRPSPEG